MLHFDFDATLPVLNQSTSRRGLTMSQEGFVLTDELRTVASVREKRTTLRVDIPFHATVQGRDSAGDHFNIETVLDNISRDGLYMRMMPDVNVGAHLSIDVGLYTASHITENAPRFSVDGVVLRKDKKAGGVAGIAVAFLRVTFS